LARVFHETAELVVRSHPVLALRLFVGSWVVVLCWLLYCVGCCIVLVVVLCWLCSCHTIIAIAEKKPKTRPHQIKTKYNLKTRTNTKKTKTKNEKQNPPSKKQSNKNLAKLLKVVTNQQSTPQKQKTHQDISNRKHICMLIVKRIREVQHIQTKRTHNKLNEHITHKTCLYDHRASGVRSVSKSNSFDCHHKNK
jgi:hypothetical protein